MAVSTIGNNPTQAAAALQSQTSANTGASVMGKDDFLKLLVTQMSHQDPLNPMDGQQFAAQLAQFSSVEQLINIGGALESQQALQELQAQSTSNSIATGLIGKNVDATDVRINLKRPEEETLTFDLPVNTEKVTITIRDSSGNAVRTLSPGSCKSGTQDVAWDGKDSSGAFVPDGAYTFEVSGEDAAGNVVEGDIHRRGLVERVSFGPEGALLWIDGLSIPLSAVRSVDLPTE